MQIEFIVVLPESFNFVSIQVIIIWHLMQSLTVPCILYFILLFLYACIYNRVIIGLFTSLLYNFSCSRALIWQVRSSLLNSLRQLCKLFKKRKRTYLFILNYLFEGRTYMYAYIPLNYLQH